MQRIVVRGELSLSYQCWAWASADGRCYADRGRGDSVPACEYLAVLHAMWESPEKEIIFYTVDTLLAKAINGEEVKSGYFAHDVLFRAAVREGGFRVRAVEIDGQFPSFLKCGEMMKKFDTDTEIALDVNK